MPRAVKGPDGVLHSFPDDATDAEISSALGAVPQANTKAAPKARTWTDVAVDALPAIGGAAGGIIGGIGGTAFGMGVGGVPGAVGGAALGGGAGEAARQLINRVRGADAPATSTEAAQKIGTQSAIQGGAEAAGLGIGAVTSAAGKRLMQSAVKPSTALLENYNTSAPKLVKTLLDEGVNVTQGGVEKLDALLTAKNAEIANAIASSPAEVSALKVAGRLNSTAKTMLNQVNPEADLAAVSDVGQQFLNHPRLTGPTMSVADAQALKQGTYRQLAGKYGELSSASNEAQKALARGLKEEIASAVPGVAQLNAEDSALMAAREAVGRRVALSGNRDPVGFAWVAQHPATFLAAILDRSPAVKSMVARGMYSSAGAAAKVAPQLIRAAVAALASSDEPATDQGSK